MKKKISRMFFRAKMNKRKFLFFLTTAPDGTQYLSISKFGKSGLEQRKVFQVCGELDSTPHVEGAKTKQIFLNT